MNSDAIKSMQGDSGHFQVKIVSNQYSYFIDEKTKANNNIIEKQFYSNVP